MASIPVLILFLAGFSTACQPDSEHSVIYRAYFSSLKLEGRFESPIDDTTALIKIAKNLQTDETYSNLKKGDLINVTGFGSPDANEDPCFWQSSDMNSGTEYVLFLEEDSSTPEWYKLAYNPAESNKDAVRAVRKSSEVKPPTIVTKDSSKTVEDGLRKLALKCTYNADAYPPPAVTWTFNGEPLKKKPKTKKKGANIDSTYKLKKIDSSDVGAYACIADNGLTGPVQATIDLTICTKTCHGGSLKVSKCKCDCDGVTCPVAGSLIDKESCACIPPTTPAPTTTSCNLQCGADQLLDEEACSCQCLDITCPPGTRLDQEKCMCLGVPAMETTTVAATTAPKVIPCSAEDAGYCQNGGACWFDIASDSLFCLCTDPYTGPRCNVYLPPNAGEQLAERNKNLLIFGICTVLAIVFIVSLAIYWQVRRKKKRYRNGRLREVPGNRYSNGDRNATKLLQGCDDIDSPIFKSPPPGNSKLRVENEIPLHSMNTAPPAMATPEDLPYNGEGCIGRMEEPIRRELVPPSPGHRRRHHATSEIEEGEPGKGQEEEGEARRPPSLPSGDSVDGGGGQSDRDFSDDLQISEHSPEEAEEEEEEEGGAGHPEAAAQPLLLTQHTNGLEHSRSSLSTTSSSSSSSSSSDQGRGEDSKAARPFLGAGGKGRRSPPEAAPDLLWDNYRLAADPQFLANPYAQEEGEGGRAPPPPHQPMFSNPLSLNSLGGDGNGPSQSFESLDDSDEGEAGAPAGPGSDYPSQRHYSSSGDTVSV